MQVRRFQPLGGGEPDAALDDVVALANLPLDLAAGTIPASVNYRLAEECGTCSYYQEPGYCSMFEASVEEEYVCDEWTRGTPDAA